MDLVVDEKKQTDGKAGEPYDQGKDQILKGFRVGEARLC